MSEKVIYQFGRQFLNQIETKGLQDGHSGLFRKTLGNNSFFSLMRCD